MRPGGPRAVRVRVPATSANLGPGFDTFGLALSWYDEVTVSLAASGLAVEVSGESAGSVPRDESHLVVSSMLAGFRRWGAEPPGLHVRCHNTIPHGRGLGSSAAAIVAGLEGARALLAGDATDAGDAADAGDTGRGPVSDQDVLELAAELEGHPDNVAAALAGGFTLAWGDVPTTSAVRLVPHEAVLPVACVPGWEMSTETARGLLPEQVPHRDAVFNAARAALLVAAVTQVPERLFAATQDRLHQDYRAPAMPRTADLLARLRGAGIPAVLSGAGPTVLALCDGRTHAAAAVSALAGEGWRVHAPGLDLRGALTSRHDDPRGRRGRAPRNRHAGTDVDPDGPDWAQEC